MGAHKVHGKNTTTHKGTGDAKRKTVKQSWRLAKSLVVLREQINAMYPGRSKVSDGTIGDAAHSQRKSDHNPNAANVVCAIDITHDPANGPDARRMADTLRMSADSRINYVISNGEIANSGAAWRKYTGSNEHRHHFHISVVQDSASYDREDAWVLCMVDTLEEQFRPDHGEHPDEALA